MADHRRLSHVQVHHEKRSTCGSDYNDYSDNEDVGDIDYAPSIKDTGMSRFHPRPSNLLTAVC